MQEKEGRVCSRAHNCRLQGALIGVCLQSSLLPYAMCQCTPHQRTVMLSSAHSRHGDCRRRSRRQLQRRPRRQSARTTLRSAGASLACSARCPICPRFPTASMRQMASQQRAAEGASALTRPETLVMARCGSGPSMQTVTMDCIPNSAYAWNTWLLIARCLCTSPAV